MNTFHQDQEAYWKSAEHKGRHSPFHPVVSFYVQQKLKYIHSKVDFGSSILDVGAGNGYFSAHLNTFAPTTAVDYSEVMLEGNPVEQKKVMDARKLEFPDGSFDTVFCHAVLHHIAEEDRVQVIQEMARVAKKNVIIIEPNRNNPLMALFGMFKKEEHGLLFFTPKYLRSLLEKAGLESKEATPFGLLTPNRMPFANILLPLFSLFEKPWFLGISTIVITKPQDLRPTAS